MKLISVFILCSTVLLLSFESISHLQNVYLGIEPDASVEDYIIELGEEKPLHYIKNLNQDSARMGYEMVYFGQLKNKENKRISKFFVCTDCHNQVREVENLANASPTERVKYGIEKDIPFLPASTFYGMYNKEHWYNGDYKRKYGDLVKPTLDTLENAIQLCAVQCSQGRSLEKWEIRSILHYYKSIEIKVKDLLINQEKLNALTDNRSKIELIKSKYNQINDATFGDVDQKQPLDYKENLKNGAYIFKNGCLHCHKNGKNITAFEFDDNTLTFSFLEAKLQKHHNYSVPYIVRKGTYSVSGKKQYMPQYPLEKMDNYQLYDLINYIKSQTK